MKKMNFFQTAFIAAAALLTFAQCDNKQPADQVNKPDLPTATTGKMKIAYVDMDSVSSRYQLYLDLKKSLQKKQSNAESTLYKKGKDLNALAQQIQANMQTNKYTREQYEAAQRNFAQQQQSLQALQERLGNEFQTEQNKAMQEVHDSITNFLRSYNKDKKYTMIVEKANTLLIDPACDITKDVIAGLNKRYSDKTNKK